jgi:hypothetical protein
MDTVAAPARSGYGRTGERVVRSEQHDQDGGEDGEDEDREGHGPGTAAPFAHRRGRCGLDPVISGLVVGPS